MSAHYASRFGIQTRVSTTGPKQPVDTCWLPGLNNRLFLPAQKLKWPRKVYNQVPQEGGDYRPAGGLVLYPTVSNLVMKLKRIRNTHITFTQYTHHTV